MQESYVARNPFSYQEFADDKLVVLDIRARDSAGRWLNIEMRSAISICLLNRRLFRDDTIPHHRFRLADPEHGREVSDAIEVHTLELTKYKSSFSKRFLWSRRSQAKRRIG
jgi:hypothetical protein